MITLRNFIKEDAFGLQKEHPHMSIKEIENMIFEWNKKQVNDKYFEMFAIVNDTEMVGMISLYQHSPNVISCGPEIFECYRKRGFAGNAMMLAMKKE